MAIPVTKLELGFAADALDPLAGVVWTDASDKMRGAWSIRRGRSHELAGFQAATATFRLDNKGGEFDPDNPVAYGITAVELDGSGDYISTPDAAALDITGDLDLRVAVALEDWTPTTIEWHDLVSKWNATGNQLSFRFAVQSSDGGIAGRPGFVWSNDGVAENQATATTNPTIADRNPLLLRVTLDVNNGASGRDIKFYTKPLAAGAVLPQLKDNTGWTQLGTTVTQAGVTSIFSGTAAGLIGAINAGTGDFLNGKVYTAVILNGINGTVAADPDFSAGRNAGTTSFTDAAGRLWTYQGGAHHLERIRPLVRVRFSAVWASVTYPLFTGYVEDFEPDYSAGQDAWVELSCVDAFKVLNLFEPDLSPYAKAVKDLSPSLYWRMTVKNGLVEDETANNFDGTPVRNLSEIDSLVAADSDRALNLGPLGTVKVANSTIFDIERTVPWSASFVFRAVMSTTQFFILKNSGFQGYWMESDGRYLAVRIGDDLVANRIHVRSERCLERGVVYHVVVTYSGSGAASGVKIYLDGLDAGTKIDNDTLGANSILNAGLWRVGNSSVGYEIDEVAFWNGTVLTAAQAKTLADAARRPWGYQRSSERISALLDLLGWAVGDRVVDLGAITLEPLDAVLGSGLDHGQQVAATEVGVLYVDREGKIAFRNRHAGQGAITLTFGDIEGETRYRQAERSTDETNLWSDVQAKTPSGSIKIATDPSAVSQFGRRTLTVDGLWSADAQAEATARYLRGRYSTAKRRFSLVEPSEVAELWPLILGRELHLDRVRIRKRPPNVALVEQESWIEGMTWSGRKPDRFSCSLNLVPADAALSRHVLGTTNLGAAGAVLAP